MFIIERTKPAHLANTPCWVVELPAENGETLFRSYCPDQGNETLYQALSRLSRNCTAITGANGGVLPYALIGRENGRMFTALEVYQAAHKREAA